MLDQFGFYKFNEKKYFSRFQMMQDCQDPKKVSFHYNDEFFSQFSWLTEPSISLDQLYRNRAEELRNTYDYLVLFYSGGSDSENILHTFVDNDIHIDEICHNVVGFEDKDSYMNSEVYNIAIPKVKLMQDRGKLVGTTHTIYDWSLNTVSGKFLDDDYLSWSNLATAYVTSKPHGATAERLGTPKWKELISSGKRVAFIHGYDKPRIFRHNGQFSFRFSDAIHHIVCFRDSLVRGILPAAADESFYWAPRTTCANIIIKQCHVIKNFINTKGHDTLLRTIYQMGGFSGEVNVHARNHAGDRDYDLGGNILKDILYSSWSNNLDDFYNIKRKFRYNCKPTGNVITEKVDWFVAGNSSIADKYLSTIKKSQESISTAWFDVSRPTSVANVHGRQYYNWLRKINSRSYYFS